MPMKQVCGLDVHKDSVFVCILNENGVVFQEKYHTPGTVKGYYYDEEYPFLMERVLEIVREMKPELKDLLI